MGGFLFPFLLGTLLEKLGFAWMVRIWSGITGLAFTASLLTLKPRLPVPKRINRGEFIPMDMRFLYNPTVIVMVCSFLSSIQVRFVYSQFLSSQGITTLLSSLAFFPVSIYITTYTVAISTPTSANFILAIYNAANVIGQVVVGYLSDKFDYGLIIAIIGLIGSISVSFFIISIFPSFVLLKESSLSSGFP